MKDRDMTAGIPKSVREAMSRQAVRGPHPAADQLNAYAERALTEPENALVISHLATCADCREVVFLAKSAVDIPTKPVILVERRSMWRWAMPATALLAVAIAFTVLVRTENPKATPVAQVQKATETQPTTNDQVTANGDTASQASAPKVATAPASKPATTANKEKPIERKTLAAHQAPISGLAKAESRTGLSNRSVASSDGVIGGLAGGKIASVAPAATANIPNGQALEMRQNSNMQNAMGGPRASQNIAQSQPAPQSVAGNYRSDNALKDVMSAAPPPAAPPASMRDSDTKLPEEKSRGELQSFAASSMELDAQPQKQRNAISRMAITVWRISSDGHLERMMQNQWKRALGGVQQTFRAVAYLGNHVWAGGAGPELFHSADGGENWNTLKVKTDDAELRGAMQSIKATDEKHVAIIADDGSVWITANGGQTWTKQ